MRCEIYFDEHGEKRHIIVRDEALKCLVDEINELMRLNRYHHLLRVLLKNEYIFHGDYSVIIELYVKHNSLIPCIQIRSPSSNKKLNFEQLWKENRERMMKFLEKVKNELKECVMLEA